MTLDPHVAPPFAYRPDVIAALLDLGVRPAARTPPPLLRDYVNDLYRWELRRLRARLLAGHFPKTEYAGRVVALRARYSLLSLPLESWLVARGAADDRGRDA